MNYCMSDIHGQYAAYAAMLERIRLCRSDTLYVLGDVIDRGPDGVRILRDMMARPNVIPILGNHEFTAAVCLSWLLKEVTEQNIAELDEARFAALQDWTSNGGEPTIRELDRLSREERAEILDYLRDMGLFAEVDAGGRSFVLTHSGLGHFHEKKPLEDYTPEDFLFCRPAPGRRFYSDRLLVYGHTPTRVLCKRMGRPPEDKILRAATQIALDCGCGWGGRLGCLCLDTMEEFYIESEK